MRLLSARRAGIAAVLVAVLFVSGCVGSRPTLVEVDEADRPSNQASTPGGALSPVVGGDASASPNEAVPAEDPQPQGSDELEGAVAQTDDGEPVVTDATCLTDRQWVGQTMMALATPEEFVNLRPLAESGELGGLVMLGTPGADIGTQILDLKNAGPVPVLMASDEEGGIVQRLAPVLGALPSAEEQAATMTVEDVRALYADYGQRMRDLGFDVAFAPVVDLGGGPGIGTRSYGTDPATVTQLAQAVAAGYADSGIQPVFKHFPGHGRASADSHELLPITPPYAELLAQDLIPYETVLEPPDAAVMVAHLDVPGLSDGTPTSLSENTISRLLRGYGGETYEGKSFEFDGLVFSDAMNMGAIANTFSVERVAIVSLSVGTDVVLIGGGQDVTLGIDSVLAGIAEGRPTWDRVDESVGRILALKGAEQWSRCSAN